jgi:hypothetical protein
LGEIEVTFCTVLLNVLLKKMHDSFVIAINMQEVLKLVENDGE